MEKINFTPQMRTLPQMAEELEGSGITYANLYRWAKEGAFPVLKRGRRFIVNRDNVIKFLQDGGKSNDCY